MITNNANLQNPKPPHNFIAGMLPSDSNIEFVGIPATKEVIWLQFGNSHRFEHLPQTHFDLLDKAYTTDYEAVSDIIQESGCFRRQVEIYTYHMYGAADYTPDIIDGVLQPSENFRHSKAYNYINWKNKHITINGHHLNTRQIAICDMMLQDLTDKEIADKLNIAESTLPFHKRKLYDIAGAQSKSHFVMILKDERI